MQRRMGPEFASAAAQSHGLLSEKPGGYSIPLLQHPAEQPGQGAKDHLSTLPISYMYDVSLEYGKTSLFNITAMQAMHILRSEVPTPQDVLPILHI